MSKRKATGGAKTNDAGQAKMPRHADPPTEAAAAAAAGRDSRDAALAHAQMARQIAAQTLRLIKALQATGGSCGRRVQSVVNLLKEDADRPESLIDLSLSFEGDESCVMFELLRFLHCFAFMWSDDDDMEADKAEAEQVIIEELLPQLPHQLRSFDPATVDAKTDNNALHEMRRLFRLDDDWTSDLLEQLIARGVSVHTRNNKGRTPLLEYAFTSVPELSSAFGIRQLLARGADLHAQDADGNGLLHLLVKQRAHGLIEDFCAGSQSEQPDFALLNAAGQTAADLAAVQVAKLQPDDSEEEDEEQAERLRQARLAHQVVAAHTWAWTKYARPALLLCLEGALPAADVAKIALAYVDDSGSPFNHEAQAQAQVDEPLA